MVCLIGLGNPGSKYHETRHNAGFSVMDRILHLLGATTRNGFDSMFVKTVYQGRDLLLVKPQTFMNASGQAVASVTRYYKLEPHELLVIYDDLDLPLGRIRIRLSGSAGGHRGLGSIIEHLQTDQIPRLRLGIGRPDPGVTVVDHVLSRVAEESRPKFEAGIIQASEAALTFVTHGPEYAMNHYNSIK